MNKQTRFPIIISFIFLILGIGVGLYLTSHHYDLLFGLSEAKSFCSVSAKIDCDSVNSSSYSEIFGIPLALFTAFGFFVELLLLFGVQAFSVDEKQKMARYFYYMCCGNLIMSIAMATVSSFILKTYCLMCMTIWLASVILFFCSRSLVREKNFRTLKKDFLNLFRGGESGARGILVLLLLVPVGSQLASGMWKQSIAGDSAGLEKVVQNSLAEWQSARKIDFFIEKAPQSGNVKAPMQIVEFSDFECPHCKRAAPSLHAFVNSHRDEVHFTFQNFPLDPACNKDFKAGTGHDQACRFAKAALCGDKQDKFTVTHDWIFAHQEELAEGLLPRLVQEVGLDKSAFDTCMASVDVSAEITSSLDRGRLAGVEGTPSVFVNGKLLPAGFLIPVLEAVLKTTRP